MKLKPEVYSQSLQQTSLNLSRAFINFFEKRARFPRFKSKPVLLCYSLLLSATKRQSVAFDAAMVRVHVDT
jgi:transposase